MEKYIKTNLRWPGGKSRMMKILKNYLPERIDKYYETFVGGGSVMLYITQAYRPSVNIANDIDESLINYYRSIKEDPSDVMEKCMSIKEKYGPDEFKEVFRTLDRNTAHGFFIYNKSSFSGIGRNFSRLAYIRNFSVQSINKISDVSGVIQDVDFICADYQDIGDLDGFFIYMDPPYYDNSSKGLYGEHGNLHKGFDHDRMFEWVERMSKKNQIMISYDNSEYVRSMYKDYHIHDFDFVYSMTNTGGNLCKTGKEIVITNYDVRNDETLQ